MEFWERPLPQAVCSLAYLRNVQQEVWMEKVIERTISIFSLMRTPEAAERARDRLSDYLKTIASAGETDPERLVVCGLTYLREQEPENDPLPRYSGL